MKPLASAPNVLLSRGLPLTSTRVPLNLSLLAVHKNLGIFQALAKECLKFVLCDRDRTIYILLLLVLLSMEVNLVSEKKHSKKNSVSFSSFNNSKVVLTLLIEVVTLYIRLSAIYVWGIAF